ncbi:beta-galactosidase-1-like protein 2 isoform X2 [Talpa occidentalis]|uniref:beta-galactosidase-1-like protein 2 isoform X2 n=1 Tax=Talpa occidentalis TaxID=50954 RepID=UPI00188E6677|nr:beta-galactosidase-1-like protein 2 isoform X2 [Talpa occidentalis]
MQAFLVRLLGILYLSSGLLVMTQPQGDHFSSFGQASLTPSLIKTRHEGLRAEGSLFMLEGFPFLIIAGTIHYFRVPRVYWRDSLLKLQAGGFNTVTMYIPWNLHEPKRNQYYFTQNLDLQVFITMASQVGLWVILCPGPYIGSDLDLGGLPSWLLQDPNMKLRTTYKGFTKAMNNYFDKLIPRIKSLQFKNGGPIIAVQIENEYGSYNMDKRYLRYVQKALVKRGIEVLFMTADGGQELSNGHLKNVLSTLHMKDISKKTYESLYSIQGRSPILMMVYTASSPDVWGLPRHIPDSHMLMKDLQEMLGLQFSVNFYMFHGGTNFGFMGGAKFSDSFFPVVTSYDYGGLLKENGDYTPEYFTFQEFFSSYLGLPKTELPESQPKVAYKSLTVTHFISLWDIIPYLEEPFRSVKPVTMENLNVNGGRGQSYGYILYETVIFNGGFLTSRNHVQDRGQVFLDKKFMGILDHTNNQVTIPRKNGYKDYMTLSILVENQGRLSSGKNINKERKGLTGDIYLNNSPLRKFKIFSLEMSVKFMKRGIPNIWKPVNYQPDIQGPAFFLAFMTVFNHPKDTFIKLEDWTKGVVFINSNNLGRYWNKGPQETLYLPAPWLRPGTNEVILFEELKPGQQIQFTDKPELGVIA